MNWNANLIRSLVFLQLSGKINYNGARYDVNAQELLKITTIVLKYASNSIWCYFKITDKIVLYRKRTVVESKLKLLRSSDFSESTVLLIQYSYMLVWNTLAFWSHFNENGKHSFCFKKTVPQNLIILGKNRNLFDIRWFETRSLLDSSVVSVRPSIQPVYYSQRCKILHLNTYFSKYRYHCVILYSSLNTLQFFVPSLVKTIYCLKLSLCRYHSFARSYTKSNLLNWKDYFRN